MNQARPRLGRGFTLIEMVVVVFILGLLLLLALPRYARMLENSKADDALATVQMVAAANRSFSVDNNFLTTGPLSETGCASFVCQCPGPSCSNNACSLMACHYLEQTRFDSKPYLYFAAPGTLAADPCGLGASGAFVACAKRRAGAPPGTDIAPYNAWGYTIDQGGANALPAADGPPSPPS